MIEIINQINNQTIALLKNILRVGDCLVDFRDHEDINVLIDKIGFGGYARNNESIIKKLHADYISGGAVDDENSMMAAVCSADWKVRAMAAFNVADPNAIVFDEDDRVKVYLVRGLIADKRHGVAHTDLKWLNVLAKDENPVIRELVAQYGLPAHLDLLVNDCEPKVRQEVAAHAHVRHLDILIKEFCYTTYLTIAKLGFAKYAKQIILSGYSEAIEEVAKSGHATKELLSNQDLPYTIIYSIAKYGLASDVSQSNILSHKNLPLQARIALAERGLFLDKLIDSPYMMVRMAVAEAANKEQAQKLAMDEAFEVRVVATKTLRHRYS